MVPESMVFGIKIREDVAGCRVAISDRTGNQTQTDRNRRATAANHARNSF